MRARTALVEIERQKVKLLIATEAAKKLREHARATCADLTIITAQIGALGPHETGERNERPPVESWPVAEPLAVVTSEECVSLR